MIASRRKPRPVPVGRYRYSKWRWRVLVRLIDALGLLLMSCWRMVRPVPPWRAPNRILVAQLDHLGDAILSSPLFPHLHEAFPAARIDVLASPSNREVFETDPHIDSVVVAERNWFERRPGGWALGTAVWQLGRTLRGRGYDLGIDVRGDLLSVFVLALAGIPRRVGWAMGGGGFLLTDVAAWVPGRHEVLSRLELLRRVGVAIEGPVRVRTYAADRDRTRVARRLRSVLAIRPRALARVKGDFKPDVESVATRPSEDPDELHAGRFADASHLLVVHLGAGTLAKRWPLTHWRALVARFLADQWRIVVVGGPEDVALGRGLPSHPNLLDLTSQLALGETVALLERADLFLGADSGPAHLAACAGIDSVVLFSGTNLVRQWRPWSRRTLVLRHRVACRPCHQRICPLAGHDCMTGLRPEQVYRAARRWWTRAPADEIR
jgi:ADP-heptose:LPS heptosyltransferase